MAITLVMGFDGVVPRSDNDIPKIEGYPFRWKGSNDYLRVLQESTSILPDRQVMDLRTSGGFGNQYLGANSKDVFHEYHNEKTVWYIGYRFRYTVALSSRPLENGGGLVLANPADDGDIWLGAFNNDELKFYIKDDRYTYMEVAIDWTEGKLKRWVDGYRLDDKDLPLALIEAEDFDLQFVARHSGGNTVYSRWTDFYFMVDTSHLVNDNTPSERLGGSYVRHLTMGTSTVTEGWTPSDSEKTPLEIVNTPLEETTQSRLYPYVLTSVAENASVFYTAVPTPGQMHRLGRGDIKFVQYLVNAHRFNGSTAILYSRVVDSVTDNTTSEEELTMYVDGYEGRPVAYMNTGNDGLPWTPEKVAQHGVSLYTTSGGNN